MERFYHRLSYSLGNEDWKTEEKALCIRPEDSVLAITASGDRPLNLLHSDCHKIVSIDANPFQTALCDLKKAAIGALDYDLYLSFIGLKPCNTRKEILSKIEHTMPEESVKLWRRHSGKIENGILYQGWLERCCKIASSLIRICNKKKIDPLFSFDTLEEQRSYVEHSWNGDVWRKILTYALNPLVTRFFFSDPGLYAYLGPHMRASTYLYNRIEESLKRIPIRENIILSLVFQGKIFEDAYSPYLQKESFLTIKNRLSKLTCTTKDALSFLQNAPSKSFDCYSLSDIASYMSKTAFEHLLAEMIRTARPKARFCIREFMSSHTIPTPLSSHFTRNYALEQELEAQDRCFIYRFKVGTLN